MHPQEPGARCCCTRQLHAQPSQRTSCIATPLRLLAVPGNKKTARLHELRFCGLALHCIQQRLHPPLLLLELGGPGVGGPPRLGCRRPQGVRVGVGCKGEEGAQGSARERVEGRLRRGCASNQM